MRTSLLQSAEPAAANRFPAEANASCDRTDFAELLADGKTTLLQSKHPGPQGPDNVQDADTRTGIGQSNESVLDGLLGRTFSKTEAAEKEKAPRADDKGDTASNVTNFSKLNEATHIVEFVGIRPLFSELIQSQSGIRLKSEATASILPKARQSDIRDSDHQDVLALDTPVAQKRGSEKRLPVSVAESLSRKEANLVALDGTIAQKDSVAISPVFGNLIETNLRDSFTQLIEAEFSPQEAGKPPELSLHLRQGTDGPEVKRLKLQLQPENLGTLSVNIYKQDDGLRIVVQAQTAAAQEKFVAEQDDILRSMDMAGVKVSELTIQLTSNAASETGKAESGQSFQPGFGHPQSGGQKHGMGSEKPVFSAVDEGENEIQDQSGLYI